MISPRALPADDPGTIAGAVHALSFLGLCGICEQAMEAPPPRYVFVGILGESDD